jgi:hypothetical protein
MKCCYKRVNESLFHNNPFKEECIYFVMTDNKMKFAVIAGADAAMKYKESHKFADSQEVIKFVTQNVEEILEKIDKDL